MKETTTPGAKGTEGSDQHDVNSIQQIQIYRILWAVEEGNGFQASKCVSLLSHEGMAGDLDDQLTEWQFYLIKLLSLLSFTMRNKGKGYRYVDLLEKDYMKKTEAAHTILQCKRLLQEIVDRFCEMSRGDLERFSSLVQHIVTAVEMDLTQPLTLQYFSDQLSVNSSYLSNLFRQETGTTLTEYVTGKRIMHAANLLRHTREPVKTVAKQVGITDVQYFSRLFKKRMGITPTQYRYGYDRKESGKSS